MQALGRIYCKPHFQEFSRPWREPKTTNSRLFGKIWVRECTLLWKSQDSRESSKEFTGTPQLKSLKQSASLRLTYTATNLHPHFLERTWQSWSALRVKTKWKFCVQSALVLAPLPQKLAVKCWAPAVSGVWWVLYWQGVRSWRFF